MLDVAAFRQLLARCDLSHCRGMCCYDGVYLRGAAGKAIETLAIEYRAAFDAMELDLPLQTVVEGDWRGQVTGPKTAVKPFAFAAYVAKYPAHFNPTACVFHLDDGRCGLQLLGEGQGLHPWTYKPLACWLHPIHVSEHKITLFSAATDPLRLPDYDGYASRTFCGQPATQGQPAYKVLRPELDYLGKLLGRDLLAHFPADRVMPQIP